MREEILNAIISGQEELVENLHKSIATYESTTDLDEHDTIDLDDQSHQVDIQDMEQEIRHKLKMEINDLKHIKSLRCKETNQVKEGAVIETEKAIFFVGFAFAPLDFKDKKILGISLAAPAFHANEGKKEGEQLILGNTQQKILSIY